MLGDNSPLFTFWHILGPWHIIYILLHIIRSFKHFWCPVGHECTKMDTLESSLACIATITSDVKHISEIFTCTVWNLSVYRKCFILYCKTIFCESPIWTSICILRQFADVWFSAKAACFCWLWPDLRNWVQLVMFVWNLCQIEGIFFFLLLLN